MPMTLQGSAGSTPHDDEATCSDCGKPECDANHDDANPNGHFFNTADPLLAGAPTDARLEHGRQPFPPSAPPASRSTAASPDKCVGCGMTKSEGFHRGRGSHTFATVFTNAVRSHAGIAEAIERAVASIRICITQLGEVDIRVQYDEAGGIQEAIASVQIAFVFAKDGDE